MPSQFITPEAGRKLRLNTVRHATVENLTPTYIFCLHKIYNPSTAIETSFIAHCEQNLLLLKRPLLNNHVIHEMINTAHLHFELGYKSIDRITHVWSKVCIYEDILTVPRNGTAYLAQFYLKIVQWSV